MHDVPFGEPMIKRLDFERVKLQLQQSLADEMLLSASQTLLIDVVRDEAMRAFRIRLTAEAFASHPEVRRFEMPATWRDHWKKEHPRLARWLRLSAPKMITTEHRVYGALCPHLTPDRSAHALFLDACRPWPPTQR